MQLRIGEIAKLVGVSTKTVRHYHKLGLLPEPERGENNYRLYQVKDVFRLQLIRRLGALGFALVDVGAILRAEDADGELRHRLQQLDGQLAEQIETLQSKRRELAGLLNPELSLREFEGRQPAATYEALLSRLARAGLELPENFFTLDRELMARLDGLNWQAGEPHQVLALVDMISRDARLVEGLIAIYESFEMVRAWTPEDDRLPGLAADLSRLAREIRRGITGTSSANKKLGLYGEVILAASDEMLEPAQIHLRRLLQEALDGTET